ncbi:esterase OVCA2 [Suncus etruscus]|uniref:esterase OVCA2 n=1 Tax=Suncus etruscus TaxID=109475 RepID=UPI002110C751|nr:esterase OVCA2 [Suncus etruscus]
MAAPPPLRVLCLAGFRQSERGFREKTGALRKALRGRAELVCLSGPHPIREAAEPDSGEERGPGSALVCTLRLAVTAPHCSECEEAPAASLRSVLLPALVPAHPAARPLSHSFSYPTPSPPSVSAELCAPEELPRGWWFSEAGADVFTALEEPAECRGLEAALDTVARALQQLGPFDGLLGFSQGAALAALVCALGQAGDARFPSPRFVILVSGFCPRGRDFKEAVLQTPLALPSLHVFGDTDRVIPSQESRQLASRFSGAVTLNHTGGHFIPAAAPQRQAYLKFLDQFAA